jgi:lysophospholipase L1-like esterase
LVRDTYGHTQIVVGQSDLTTPQPPILDPNQQLVANIFVDYFSSGKNCEIFKISKEIKLDSHTSRGLIPKTLNKLKTGEPVKIINWGDSVTAGGDASKPEARYTFVFDKMLRTKFPKADITTTVIAVGGSTSRQWLYPEKFKHPTRAKDCNFAAIINSRPDLVTIEFVNDAGLKPVEVNEVYSDIRKRLEGIGSEIILITPHFTSPVLMPQETSRACETREYVFALRDFAIRNNIALADASARWEHLQFEGLPYITLLKNGINHPDDRGHAIFAQELIKCFDEK